MRDVPEKPTAVMKCDEIQAQLFAYLTREMGEGRTDLIREHLKKCPACQAEATQVRETLGFLRDASELEDVMPTRLSEERRALIVRAFMHPFLDAVYRHHVLVSVAITIMALLILSGVLRKVKVWHTEKLNPGVSVTIGSPTIEGPATNR